MSKSGNIHKLYDLAGEQWGMVTSAQALGLGVSRTQLSRMAADGRLEPVCYGVYRVTAGEETLHAGAKAAWLSLSPRRTAYERLGDASYDAVATGRTAARMHGYGDFHASPYCFAVRESARTARRDLELFRVGVDGRDATLEFGIPVATLERTVADLVRLHEDPSLIDGVMVDAAANGYSFDRGRLSELLDPLAKREGFSSGCAFAEDLVARNVAPRTMEKIVAEFSSVLDSARSLLTDEAVATVGEALFVLAGAAKATGSVNEDILSASVCEGEGWTKAERSMEK